MPLITLLLAALLGGDDEARKPGQAGKTLPLSVREAVALSLNHNLDIEVARYQPWIEEQNVLITLGAWDHVLYGSAVRGESKTPGTSQLSGASRLEDTTKDVEVGVRKLLPFGGTYDIFAGG